MIAPSPECVERMAVFDSLPKPLRVEIAGAAFVYEPQEMADRLANGRSLKTILRGIVAYERRAR